MCSWIDEMTVEDYDVQLVLTYVPEADVLDWRAAILAARDRDVQAADDFESSLWEDWL